MGKLIPLLISAIQILTFFSFQEMASFFLGISMFLNPKIQYVRMQRLKFLSIHEYCIQRPSVRSDTITGNLKPFENVKKCFLLHLKSSFSSLEIQMSVLIFWS